MRRRPEWSRLRHRGDPVLDAPYTIGFQDDRSITVGEAGTVTAYTNFEIGEEVERYFDAAPTVTASVLLDPDDTDSRIISVISVLALLALAWGALLQLRRIVRSARDGDPFDSAERRTLPLVGWDCPGRPTRARSW